MKNITLTLNSPVAAWARIHAAHCGLSLSALIEELLQSRMREVLRYEEAMQCFLARGPFEFEWDGQHRSVQEGL